MPPVYFLPPNPTSQGAHTFLLSVQGLLQGGTGSIRSRVAAQPAGRGPFPAVAVQIMYFPLQCPHLVCPGLHFAGSNSSSIAFLSQCPALHFHQQPQGVAGLPSCCPQFLQSTIPSMIFILVFQWVTAEPSWYKAGARAGREWQSTTGNKTEVGKQQSAISTAALPTSV